MPDWHIFFQGFLTWAPVAHPSPLDSSPNSDHRAFTASDIARTRVMIRSPSSPPTILPPYLAANLSGCHRSSILRNLAFVADAGTANHGASNDALDVPSPMRSALPGGHGTASYPTGRSDASSVAHASSWRRNSASAAAAASASLAARDDARVGDVGGSGTGDAASGRGDASGRGNASGRGDRDGSGIGSDTGVVVSGRVPGFVSSRVSEDHENGDEEVGETGVVGLDDEGDVLAPRAAARLSARASSAYAR